MKKGAYAVLFSALVTSCGPKYAPPPNLPSSITQISTPQETQQWLDTVLTYERDPILHGTKDFWAPCSLTYALRKGDCEDYAICAAALLENDVEQGYIIYINNPGKDKAHAVFAYRINGHWGINSNNRSEYRLPTSSSLRSILIDALADDYTNYSIYDYQEVDLINGNQDLKSKMKKIREGELK